jgi:hypothetical protein
MDFEIDPLKMFAVVWILVTFTCFAGYIMFAQVHAET